CMDGLCARNRHGGHLEDGFDAAHRRQHLICAGVGLEVPAPGRLLKELRTHRMGARKRLLLSAHLVAGVVLGCAAFALVRGSAGRRTGAMPPPFPASGEPGQRAPSLSRDIPLAIGPAGPPLGAVTDDEMRRVLCALEPRWLYFKPTLLAHGLRLWGTG